MRILVASDLHYRLPHYDWLVEQAPDFDVVVIPGDHLDLSGSVPFDAQMVVIAAYLDRLAARTTLLTTSGNHDLDGPGPHGEQVAGWLHRWGGVGTPEAPHHTDGATLDLGGIRFTMCPWWDGPATKEVVSEQLALAARDRSGPWVWLYHSPPGGTGLCTSGRRSFPDDDLRAWIEQYQPDLVFTGHVHEAPWVDGGAWSAQIGRTWAFNPGRQAGSFPPHIIVDTDAGKAEWDGASDWGEVDLGDLAG